MVMVFVVVDDGADSDDGYWWLLVVMVLVMMVPVLFMMNFNVIASFSGCFHVKEKYFIKIHCLPFSKVLFSLLKDNLSSSIVSEASSNSRHFISS